MATALQIQQLYVAYFGRPADPAGLDYWVSTGISTKDFAAAMYAQPEFQQANASLPVIDQVNALYLNLFGRSGDAEGLLYWTQQINTGKLTLASIANDLIFAANNNSSAQSQLDKTALNNKTSTAIAYTEDVRETSASLIAYNATSTTPWVTGSQFTSAVNYLATVTQTAPTAPAIQASVDAMTATSTPGQTFTLTTGSDTATATNFVGDVQVNSGVVLNTLNNGDRLTGSGSDASLNVTLLQNNGNAGYTVGPALLSNISRIAAQFATVGAGAAGVVTLDLGNATGVRSVDLADSTLTNVVSNIQSVLSAIALTNTGNNGARFNFGANVLAGTTDAVTLALSAVAGGTVTLTAGYETITIASGGSAANTIGTLAGAGATLNLTGAQGLTITDTLREATTTINGATATGALKIVSNIALANLTITGGTADDTFTLGDFYNGGTSGATRDIINGGTGTNTLSITNISLAGITVNQANVTNIQTIAISDVVTNNIDLTLFSSATRLNFAAANGANTYTFNTGSTVSFAVDGGDAARSYVIGGTGIADALTLTKGSAAVNLGNDTQTFTGIETLNINTNKTAGGLLTVDGALTMVPTAGGTSTINVSGANGLTLTHQVTASVINASALTAGSLVITSGFAGAANITGSAQADTLSGSAASDIISGGGGNDNITGAALGDILTGGAGVNTFFYDGVTDTGTAIASTTVAVGAAGAVDIITDFKAGDKINLATLRNIAVADELVNASANIYATATANLVALVSGSYNEVTRIFTAGARTDANNDYLFQYNGGNTIITVNNVVFLNTAGALASFTSATEVLTFA